MMRTKRTRRTNNTIAPRQRLVRQITSCWRTQALHAAVLLDLPDQLAMGKRDISSLADACGCVTDSLQRLLHALCVLQVCRLGNDGNYELTAAGEALRRIPSDGFASMRAFALWWGGAMWPMWSDLSYSVRTGKSARARQTGSENYAFLETQPAMAVVFHEAMQAMTELITADVVELEAWQEVRTLVDVGGGNGTLAAAIAAANPQLRVTVLDRTDATPANNTPFYKLVLEGRATFIAGSFFDALPEGADCYLLKSILHNWDDTACRRILATCAAASFKGARLLLVERIRPARMKPTHHDEALTRTDLNMLAGLGGRERSLTEYTDLMASAGFHVTRVSPTQHEFSVIEALRT